MKVPPKPVVTPRRLAVAAVFLLLFYVAAIGWRGFVLMRTGSVVGILLGLALLALPVVGLWAVVRELRFGVATEILAEELEGRGELPADDLPRSPGGRVDRAAADAWFETFKREVEERPEAWEAWFRLACGYDAAGDRKRGRAAMRQAIALHGPLAPAAAPAKPAEAPAQPAEDAAQSAASPAQSATTPARSATTPARSAAPDAQPAAPPAAPPGVPRDGGQV